MPLLILFFVFVNFGLN